MKYQRICILVFVYCGRFFFTGITLPRREHGTGITAENALETRKHNSSKKGTQKKTQVNFLDKKLKPTNIPTVYMNVFI